MKETPPTQKAETPPPQNALLPCPFCGILPIVKTALFGFSMGRLMEREDGSKYDPGAGQLYTTEFSCASGCPINSLRIHGSSPNPQAFYDRVDRSKTEEQVHAEAVSAWNQRAAQSVSTVTKSDSASVQSETSSVSSSSPEAEVETQSLGETEASDQR